MNDSALALIQQLRTIVPDPARRALVCDVLRLSIVAIEQLSVLDETIYESLVEEQRQPTRLGPERSELMRAAFCHVHRLTFAPVRELCAYLVAKRLLGNLDKVLRPTLDSIDVDSSFDALFESPRKTSPVGCEASVRREQGTTETSLTLSLPSAAATETAKQSETEPVLEELDRVFDAIAGPERDLMKAYSEFVEQIGIVGQQLVRQAERYDRRVGEAIDGGRFELALREIDLSRQSLSEGLFVLVCGLFKAFGMTVERRQIVPAYQDAVEQSVMLRTGLAQLEEVVASENDWVIQDPTMSRQDVIDGLGRVANELHAFLSGPLKAVLRAPDRLELERFLETLRAAAMPEATLACEGLLKYLESLRIISQREVLVQHDAQVMDEIRECLEAARSLLGLSPTTAVQVLGQGLARGKSLRGRNAAFDEFIDRWAQSEGEFNDERLRQMIEAIDQLLR